MNTIATLLRAGRAPAELMNLYAAQDWTRGVGETTPASAASDASGSDATAHRRPQPDAYEAIAQIGGLRRLGVSETGFR